MDYLHLVLRIIHIGAGVFWVGGVLMMAFFIAPAVRATGEAGQKFAAHMAGELKLTQRMTIASWLTALAGFSLYAIDSDGFSSAVWMRSGAGIGFGIGATFGLIGLIFGNIIGFSIRSIMKLGAEMQGKQPSPEQLARLQSLQKRQAIATNIAAYSLILSVIFMAIARFLAF